MSLTTPFSVQKLQMALHAKAKESPTRSWKFRFPVIEEAGSATRIPGDLLVEVAGIFGTPILAQSSSVMR